jgi:hypothetical protein
MLTIGSDRERPRRDCSPETKFHRRIEMLKLHVPEFQNGAHGKNDFTASGGARFRSRARYIGGFSRAALK